MKHVGRENADTEGVNPWCQDEVEEDPKKGKETDNRHVDKGHTRVGRPSATAMDVVCLEGCEKLKQSPLSQGA